MGTSVTLLIEVRQQGQRDCTHELDTQISEQLAYDKSALVYCVQDALTCAVNKDPSFLTAEVQTTVWSSDTQIRATVLYDTVKGRTLVDRVLRFARPKIQRKWERMLAEELVHAISEALYEPEGYQDLHS